MARDMAECEGWIMIEILELREAGENGGDLMGYYCHGHVDRYEFAKKANYDSGADAVYDIRYVRPEKCLHVWWRTVPLDDGCSQFVPAEGPARGAWPATVCDCVEESRHRKASRAVDEWNKGRLHGIAGGVEWCLRTLEDISPESGEMLLGVFKRNRDRIEEDKS